MPENDLEQELRDIVRESIPPVVFPDVQRVIVENPQEPVINVTVPEVKIPEITVPQPKVTVNVPEPKVITDNTGVIEAVRDLQKTLEANKPSNDDILDALDKHGERVVKGVKEIKFYGGGGAGVFPTTIQGTMDNGSPKLIPVTQEGHIEVAVHGPRLPFGSIHSENLTPIFQSDAVYGVNPAEVTATTGLSVGTGAGSGTATASANNFVCTTGTTQYSFGTIQSRKRLRYRAGQGLVGRFAGLFSTPAVNAIVVAGFGTAEAGYYFGYRSNGTFGILRSTGGVREIHTLTITTPSTATNNYVITLPNTATVEVAATNNNNTARTAYEIAQGTFPGWKAESRGSTVVFVANSAGPVSGLFSLAQTGAVTPAAGTDAETLAGVASTDTWVNQSDWNGDKCDGTGPSGFVLDPQKGNVYEIGVQYLGYGTVTMRIEAVSAGKNNADFITVHTFKHNNTLVVPHISQPSFPFTMAAYSAGSTTDVSVKVGSFAGFIEGKKFLNGPRMSYGNVSGVTSSTSAYTPLFTVRNDYVYAGRVNQSVVNLLSVNGAAKSTTGITTFYLIRNATLTGNANFTQYATTSSTYWDTASTACTFSTNDQIVFSFTVSESGQFTQPFSDEITLQPGETMTLAVRSVSATATCIGSLNTREDQ